MQENLLGLRVRMVRAVYVDPVRGSLGYVIIRASPEGVAGRLLDIDPDKTAIFVEKEGQYGEEIKGQGEQDREENGGPV